ncbi:hypothetical protein CgunFtcFv8_010302 [Champsocephalus gunnari]|uniref:Uncharacterized protein n=1 Tax=Champsocephalus gunnari TaxID=52237 RepID=A0AAN8HV28_CHAGU|nr:hypothetical protein CgunFtcFv8_010302 [Champsocephalus gunnari]
MGQEGQDGGWGVDGLQFKAQGLQLISQGSVLAVWPQAETVRRRVDHGYLSPPKTSGPRGCQAPLITSIKIHSNPDLVRI